MRLPALPPVGRSGWPCPLVTAALGSRPHGRLCIRPPYRAPGPPCAVAGFQQHHVTPLSDVLALMRKDGSSDGKALISTRGKGTSVVEVAVKSGSLTLSIPLALLAPICWVTTKSPDFGHVSPPLVARRNFHTCNASPSPKHPTGRALTGAG